jgi:RHS repeat-associated protein
VHNDPLGTPQALTNEAGTVVWRADYDPFGKVTPNEDPDGDGNTVTFNVRLPGQYYDQETGLHYNYFRYYDPGTGRYTTSDPIGLEGGLNSYGFVNGNPLRWVDQYGLLGYRPPGPDQRRGGIPGYGLPGLLGPFGPVCGSGSSATWIPDGPFKRACEFHDKCYGTCGASKATCDLTFLLLSGSPLYYGAVTFFGGDAYEKAQKQSCENCNK